LYQRLSTSGQRRKVEQVRRLAPSQAHRAFAEPMAEVGRVSCFVLMLGSWLEEIGNRGNRRPKMTVGVLADSSRLLDVGGL